MTSSCLLACVCICLWWESRPQEVPGHKFGDKLHKIRPRVEHLRTKYWTIAMEENLRIDKQVVSFKCWSSLRQKSPNSSQVGLQGVGFVWSERLCLWLREPRYTLAGKTMDSEEDWGVSGNVVIVCHDQSYQMWVTSFSLTTILTVPICSSILPKKESGQSVYVSEWVSSFLAAHQHAVGYSVP